MSQYCNEGTEKVTWPASWVKGTPAEAPWFKSGDAIHILLTVFEVVKFNPEFTIVAGLTTCRSRRAHNVRRQFCLSPSTYLGNLQKQDGMAHCTSCSWEVILRFALRGF